MLSEDRTANRSRKLLFDIKDSLPRSQKGLIAPADIIDETSYQSVMVFRNMVFPSSFSKANSQVELATRGIQSSYGIKQHSDHDESWSPSTDSHPYISLSSSMEPPEVGESWDVDDLTNRRIKIRKSLDSSQCRSRGIPRNYVTSRKPPACSDGPEVLAKDPVSRHVPALRSKTTRSSSNENKKILVTFEHRRGCLRKTRREEVEVSDVLANVRSVENRGQGIDVQIMKNRVIREQFEEYLENEVSGICTVKKVRYSR
eukprot:GHVH01007788.1.p1 GENE.GHVH01007788.1~~GHVH01007788.1.p1  ORF type:complete len:258 (+),score=27.75 GHVH01007788.1:388-1161(+)